MQPVSPMKTLQEIQWAPPRARPLKTRASRCKWPPTWMVWFAFLAGFGARHHADSLRFTSIQMPALVQRGTNFWLACQYELEPVHSGQSSSSGEPAESEQLYSVKWYKNNEEFYRIIFGSAGQQQQYFTQPGVNVLMSSSNATHVRLLNGSLESEGAFACEISTQNLSTIRFEKEIKVYVLPASGLSLAGLRSFYALGDQVELQCSSDFGRPAAALAWFINGRRFGGITTNNDQVLATAAAANEPSPSEPKLSRARLTLKFKLTSELLAELAAAPPAASSSRPGQTWPGNNINSQQRNQSKSPPGLSADSAPNATANIQTGRLLELMRLECRYKLAEVSDVTFAELKVATQTGSGPANHKRRPARGASWSSGRRLAAGRTEPRAPTKTLANQIQLTRSLAERDHLLELMAGASQPAACGSGLLALQREDPVLVESAELEGGGGAEGPQDEPEDLLDELGQDRLELAPNSILGVNCSTLGALSSGGPPQRRPAGGIRQWPASNEPPASAMNYCGDWEARRRLLISGRYQGDMGDIGGPNQRRRKPPPPQTAGAGTGTNRPPPNSHLIAYVSLEAHDGANRWRPRKLAASDNDNKLSLPVELSSATKSLDQLHDTSGRMQPLRHAPSAWSAPPLLEWFINNQEAPKSSASYSPELPLVGAVSNRSARSQRRQMAPPSDDEDRAALELPSIDYREYFANFESRPIDQFLVLRLALEKKHFMTPDSLLKLRCTSTQAQVLAVDSLDVSLFLLPTGVNPLDSSREQRPDSQRQSSPSKWVQRQHSAIKSKHIHRQPLASTQPDQASGAQRLMATLWTSCLALAAWCLLAA